MRIIAGKFKGREIISPSKKIELRPTSDKVREAIFDVIRVDIGGAIFLDLFAGSGAMGIEAISEGAEFAVFVEKNPKAIKTIEANIEMLGVKGQATVVKSEVNSFLKDPPFPEAFAKKFDIIFLDPPYASLLGDQTLVGLADFYYLSENSIVVAEHSIRKNLPETYKGAFTLVMSREKRYGEIAVSFYVAGK